MQPIRFITLFSLINFFSFSLEWIRQLIWSFTFCLRYHNDVTLYCNEKRFNICIYCCCRTSARLARFSFVQINWLLPWTIWQSPQQQFNLNGFSNSALHYYLHIKPKRNYYFVAAPVIRHNLCLNYFRKQFYTHSFNWEFAFCVIHICVLLVEWPDVES